MSKRISDISEASQIDSGDQILFLQASTKKTKRISRDNFAKSPGFGGSIPEIGEGGDLDTPAVPTGLVVSTSSEIMPDGTEKVFVRAKINPNTEENLDSYSWYIRRATGTPTFDGFGKLTGYSETQLFASVLESMPAEGSIGSDGKVSKEWEVIANTYYEVRVCAINTDNVSSDYTELNNTNVILTAKDVLAPNAPTNVAATSAIRTVFVSWTNPSDKDLAYVRLFRPTNPDSISLISAASRTTTTVTITTSSAHGFSNGNSVTCVGMSGSVNPNGSKTISVINSTQFSYTLGSGAGSETYSITNSIAVLTSNVGTVFEGYSDSDADMTTEQGKTYYYWLTAVDFSGNESQFPSNVAKETAGLVENTDLKDFAVNATKQFNNTIVLEGDSWTDGLTATYAISWSSHFLYYRGYKYEVPSGTSTGGTTIETVRTSYVYAVIPSTIVAATGNLVNGTKYVIAVAGTVNWTSIGATSDVVGTVFTYNGAAITGTGGSVMPRVLTYTSYPVTTEGGYPVLTDSMFMIASNVNGAHDLAWNAIANAVIGSAYIQNASIGSAKISDLKADKITSGNIDGEFFNVTGGGYIKSGGVTNLDTGNGFWLKGAATGTGSEFGVGSLDPVTGKFLKFNGTAGTLTVRGTLQATAGYFGGTSGDNRVVVSEKGLTIGSLGAINTLGTTYNGAANPPFDVTDGSGGLYIGKDSSVYRFFIGSPSLGRYVYWNGSALTVQGTINATAGYIGGTTAGWAITSNKITSGTITLDATAGAQKIYIGTGTYNNSNTSFYADASNNFSLGDKLTFASNVLTVNGTLQATAGYFGGTSGVTINATGLSVGTSGRINAVVEYNASFTPPFSDIGNVNPRGFYLGYAGSAYQFFIGHGGASPTAYLWWNGSTLSISGGVLKDASTTGSYGLTVGSTYGIRYVNNTSVLTITGGNQNGISNGAQIDLVGNSFASGNAGVLSLAAGSASTGAGTPGCILFRTGDGITMPDGSVVNSLRGVFTRTGSFVVGSSISSIISGVTSLFEVRNTISDSSGSVSESARMYGVATSNAVYLRQYFNRHTTGTSWDGVGVRLQHTVDITNKGYIEFNPSLTADGLSMGNGASEFMRMTSLGRFLFGATTGTTARVECKSLATNVAGLMVYGGSTTAVGENSGQIMIGDSASLRGRITYSASEKTLFIDNTYVTDEGISYGNISLRTRSGTTSIIALQAYAAGGIIVNKVSGNTPNYNKAIVLSTVDKASTHSTTTGQGALIISSNDSTNRLEGNISLITDATATYRRLAISAVEQTIAYRNVTICEDGGAGNLFVGTTGNGLSQSYRLYVSGNVYFTGTLTQNSVLKNKSNIKNFDNVYNSLDLIKSLRPVIFDFKVQDDKNYTETEKDMVGFIAEEVYQVFPNVVSAKDGEIHGIDYSRMVVLLVDAVKKLQQEVDDLKKKI